MRAICYLFAVLVTFGCGQDPKRDLLGSYSGFESGVAAGWGQTGYKATNGKNVQMRIIMDRTGIGLNLGLTKAAAMAGSAEQTHGWDSTIQVDRESTNW